MSQTVRHILLCLGIMISMACKRQPQAVENIPVMEIQDITSEAYSRADSILTSLSLEERVGQCLMPSINSHSDPYTLSYLKKIIDEFHIGGIVLLSGNRQSVMKLAEIGAEAKVALFMAIDAEWGLGMRLEDGSLYPKNGSLGKDVEDTYLFDYGREIAHESREVGINMVLGPVVDVSPRKTGVIGVRSFGEDPVMVSDFGVAYAKGLESGGVISVAKHFPGHGMATSDSHFNVANLNRDISALDSIDLKPFRDYISAGLTAIMAGHIRARSLDPDGMAATVSIDILTHLLREEMGFRGLVLTDAFNMGGARGFSASDALRAGADIVLCPSDVNQEYQNILDNVKSGSLEVSIVNDRCRRILFTKCLFSIVL